MQALQISNCYWAWVVRIIFDHLDLISRSQTILTTTNYLLTFVVFSGCFSCCFAYVCAVVLTWRMKKKCMQSPQNGDGLSFLFHTLNALNVKLCINATTFWHYLLLALVMLTCYHCVYIYISVKQLIETYMICISFATVQFSFLSLLETRARSHI